MTYVVRMRSTSLLMVLFSLFFSVAASAQAGADAASRPQWNAIEGPARATTITRIEAYLSGISSAVANFKQHSADGSSGSGKFFLKRPGKMRWQYDPPTPMLLVSNGKVVTFYDASVDQVTYIGVDDTLAAFLTKSEIKLESSSLELMRLESTKGQVRVNVRQRKKPDEGSLTLVFADAPLSLAGMTATDATGNETEVTFADAQFGVKLDDALFVFEDPRSVHHRRKKQR
jgi:outer membrane lipoprotein-sorting protein